ncbi:carboxylesterase [Tricladium varicosporioides]|nr:carboxylesterase [Hymenoscyphus varicosporioides]
MGNTLSGYHVVDHEIDLGRAGCIRGTQYDNKARRYAGVPYALPPIGDLRWRKPSPLPISHSYSSANGTPFDATKFGAVCLQPNYSASVKKSLSEHVFSEDCLKLNIWTPVAEGQRDRNTKWPVMIWLHGGWFQMGDPSHEIGMDPTELISTGKLNAIVVAVGYRLNLFGFLAGDALIEESRVEGGGANQVCGNYGLWDQKLAIEWVYKNISSFGGDSENITLAGRSAGAFAVQAHAIHDFQTSPSQIYKRLVMFSNAIPAQPKTPDECQPQFDELCSHFNIPLSIPGREKVARLRQVSGEDLTAAIMELKHHTFRPITDGEFIQLGLTDYLRNGSFAKEFKNRGFKLLIGEVLNEETLYAVTNGPKEANIESLHSQVSNYYAPSTSTRILSHYPLPTSKEVSDWQASFGKIISDGQVRAPVRFLANSLLSNGVQLSDVWRYCIGYRLSFITEDVAPKSFGVSHAMDKPFWNFSILHGPTPRERKLMEEWVIDLAMFLRNEKAFKYGTEMPDEYKVVTPEGEIEVQKDPRWEELLELADIFSGVAGTKQNGVVSKM